MKILMITFSKLLERLISNPFHVLQEYLLTAAVIEFCGPAVGVAGNALSGFERAVVLKKIRDTGCPEGVRRIVRWQTSLFEPSFEHSAASVRTSGRRDNLPVFPIEAGNKGDSGSFSKPVALRYWSRSSSSLWCTGSSFSLPPFSLKRSKNRFPDG